MANKNPAATFFWNDWEDDKELKLCSLAAQGLWMRLLCIAARSPEPGTVQIGDQPSTLETALPLIARSVAETVETVRALTDELLASGAASLDRKGRIYCRRMVRARGISQKRSESGKLGADATHGNRKRKPPLPRQDGGNDAGNELASSDFGLQSSGGVDRPSGEARALGNSMEVIMTADWQPSDETKESLRSEGYGIGEIEAQRKRFFQHFRGVRGTDWDRRFHGWVTREHVGKYAPREQRGDASPSNSAPDPWEKRVADYRADLAANKPRPFWPMEWGRPPGDQHCPAPAEVLARHGFARTAA